MQLTGNPQSLFSQGQHVAEEEQQPAPHLVSQTDFNDNFELCHQRPAPGDHGSRPRLAVIGGTSEPSSSGWTSTTATTMNQQVLYDFATSTDLLMRNLTMIVGNPSQRCFANAPWRAFTWLCAFLQEHNLQPWGARRGAVQESLETCEAVDLQRLPGLQTLWQQHDLNVQGDASHFVNTLWLATQSRAFAYRYAEIQPGGLLKDHIQMLIHIDFPAHCLDEVHFQDLINEWCNEGLGQYFMDEKRALVCHLQKSMAPSLLHHFDVPRPPMVSRRWTDAQGDSQSDATDCW